MSQMRDLPSKPVVRLVLFALLIAAISFAAVLLLIKPKTIRSATNGNQCPKDVTCVALKNDHAEPDVITVPVGSYAQFNSADGQLHNLGVGSGDEHHDGGHKHTGTYVSGDFKSDEAWKVQFKQTGTFDFHDHYRPELHVSVVVYQPGGDYKIK